MNAAQIRTDALPTGSRTLEIFDGTERINRWIYDRFANDLGRRVLEVGSGLGNITQFLLDRDLVVASDVEDVYVEHLRKRFGARSNLKVRWVDLDRPDPSIRAIGVDTVLAVNVLEHIKDDRAALAAMREWVGPGGRVCIYVPALTRLYGTLDVALGHHRRYERDELLEKLESSGFRVRWCRWINLFGIVGWVLSGKILKHRVLSPSMVSLYDKLVPILRHEERFPLSFATNLTVVAEAI